jgi:hypothetical protein
MLPVSFTPQAWSRRHDLSAGDDDGLAIAAKLQQMNDDAMVYLVAG